jgi:hypothetical protein
MSEQAENEDVVIEEEVSEVEQEAPEQEVSEQEEPEQQEESDEVVVSIGDESPAPQEDQNRAPDWVRELRKSHRELQKRNRELEAKLTSQHVPEKVVLGRKPTLEEHDYDAEKFESSLADWYERKRKYDEEQQQARVAEEQQQKSWQAKLDAYGKAKSELKVKDFEDAEDVTQQTLDVTQQGIVLQGADNPALVVYALGKNPKKAAELGSIKDPVKFAFAVAKLEKDLKVTPRKAVPPPEKTVSGNARVSGGAIDSSLDRLRAEAEKTGDYTKVIRYKAQQRAKQSERN